MRRNSRVEKTRKKMLELYQETGVFQHFSER
jgi:hypothetical protein